MDGDVRRQPAGPVRGGGGGAERGGGWGDVCAGEVRGISVVYGHCHRNSVTVILSSAPGRAARAGGVAGVAGSCGGGDGFARAGAGGERGGAGGSGGLALKIPAVLANLIISRSATLA